MPWILAGIALAWLLNMRRITALTPAPAPAGIESTFAGAPLDLMPPSRALAPLPEPAFNAPAVMPALDTGLAGIQSDDELRRRLPIAPATDIGAYAFGTPGAGIAAASPIISSAVGASQTSVAMSNEHIGGASVHSITLLSDLRLLGPLR